MLALTRKTGQKIEFFVDGKSVGFMVIIDAARPGNVKLGFEMTKNVQMYRAEIARSAISKSDAERITENQE